MIRAIIYLALFLPFNSYGDGLRIEVNFKKEAGKEVLLAQHYLGNIYAKDTARLDERGYGEFLSDTLLPQGLYKIYLDQDNHFDILLGSQQKFSIAIESFSIDNVSIAGSDETKAFIEYSLFLANIQKEVDSIQKKIESADEEVKAALHQQLVSLNNELHNYRDNLEKDLPNSFLVKFMRANYVPKLDESALSPEVLNNDSLLRSMRYYYQREHFWDNFDYTDERFLYTPFFKPKLETWFTKVLYQNYDSAKYHVMDFIEEVKPSARIFQFVTSFFLNSSINSKIMGMDALFVDIARKYYLTGEAFWASEESMEKIKENLLFLENNLIGMTAPDLTLESVEGDYLTLYDIEGLYTIVLIYEPKCNHCGEFVPELYTKVYKAYKEKGLEVYAIYSMDNKNDWISFIDEHGLNEWINVWDEKHASRFKILYDARYTPAIYLLDNNKTIVGKKMSVDQIRNFLDYYLK
jgi:peroxiredoxin